MPYPAKNTPQLIDAVLSRIALGETLAALGRELGFHPTAWGMWVRADEALAIAYGQARDLGADAIAEEALALIDLEPPRVEGRIDNGYVQWRRAQVDTRLKLLAKWSPKRYGDRATIDVGNKDGEALRVESNIDNAALMVQLAEALRSQTPKP